MALIILSGDARKAWDRRSAQGVRRACQWFSHRLLVWPFWGILTIKLHADCEGPATPASLGHRRQRRQSHKRPNRASRRRNIHIGGTSEVLRKCNRGLVPVN